MEGENNFYQEDPQLKTQSNIGQNPAPEQAPAFSSEPYSSSFGEKTEEISNNIKETTTGFVNKLNEFSQTSSGSILMMTVVGIVVVAIIAFVLWYIINKTVIAQSSYLLAETSGAPLVCSQLTLAKGSPIPAPSSGVRSGMTFWVYIYDIAKYQGSIRHVLHRGLKTDGFNTRGGNTLPGGPYVALDPNSSAMSIVFGPNTGTNNYFTYSIPSVNGPGNIIVDSSLTGNNTLTPTPSQMLQVAAKSRGIVIPYIPLQRWVHVACIINENVNGGTITAYVDGELAVSVTSSSTLPPTNVTVSDNNTTRVTPVTNINNINMGNTGDVYIGGSPSDPIGPGFSGLVSKVQFYNYDLSAQDVYANYQKGPIDNILAALGLPAYGIQSPIYRID